MVYLLVYSLSTVDAFGALILCGSRGKEAVSFEDLAGLGRRHPAVALAFSIFLLSLAGIPPTAGFFGKLYVFTAAMDAELYALVVLGLLNSVLGAYYYVKVMVYMYMREPRPGAVLAQPMNSGLVNAALILMALLVVGLGLLPGSILSMAASAVPAVTAAVQ
jgi:NADH-quinone oxidoreductase subunit N